MEARRVSKCRFAVELIERRNHSWLLCPGCGNDRVDWDMVEGNGGRGIYRSRCCGLYRLRRLYNTGRSSHRVSFRREALEGL